jgi:hypothetical protein
MADACGDWDADVCVGFEVELVHAAIEAVARQSEIAIAEALPVMPARCLPARSCRRRIGLDRDRSRQVGGKFEASSPGGLWGPPCAASALPDPASLAAPAVQPPRTRPRHDTVIPRPLSLTCTWTYRSRSCSIRLRTRRYCRRGGSVHSARLSRTGMVRLPGALVVVTSHGDSPWQGWGMPGHPTGNRMVAPSTAPTGPSGSPPSAQARGSQRLP